MKGIVSKYLVGLVLSVILFVLFVVYTLTIHSTDKNVIALFNVFKNGKMLSQQLRAGRAINRTNMSPV